MSLAPSPRIVALDFIRGVAILGILLLNISGFGLPSAAYLNPAWRGDISLADAWCWAILDLLAQAKFLSLFALLFGAGLWLLAGRGKAWLQARLSLLVGIGLLHGLLLWNGDILLAYGLIGLFCWRAICNSRDPAQLLRTGLLLYGIGLLALLFLGLMAHGEGRGWVPDAAQLQYEQYWKLRGGWEAISNRWSMLQDNLLALAVQYGWQLAGLMLIGGALMQNGWLRGAWPTADYRRIGWRLVFLGMALNLPGIIGQWALHWEYRWCAMLLQLPREISAPLQALGYASLIFGYWPRLAGKWLTKSVTNVGRMALSSYLLQTLLACGLFYWAGLFMQFSRWQLLLWVIPVWGINLLFAAAWLRYFRQGPVEWGWRRLTMLWVDGR